MKVQCKDMKNNNQWTKDKPNSEGYYFWKRNSNVKDPWRWGCYYVMPNEGRVKDHTGKDVPWSFWEAGMEVEEPRGGWWSKIDLPLRD